MMVTSADRRTDIADLHCPYAMHLLPDDHHPHPGGESFFERLQHQLDAVEEDLRKHDPTGTRHRIVRRLGKALEGRPAA